MGGTDTIAGGGDCTNKMSGKVCRALYIGLIGLDGTFFSLWGSKGGYLPFPLLTLRYLYEKSLLLLYSQYIELDFKSGALGFKN